MTGKIPSSTRFCRIHAGISLDISNNRRLYALEAIGSIGPRAGTEEVLAKLLQMLDEFRNEENLVISTIDTVAKLGPATSNQDFANALITVWREFRDDSSIACHVEAAAHKLPSLKREFLRLLGQGELGGTALRVVSILGIAAAQPEILRELERRLRDPIAERRLHSLLTIVDLLSGPEDAETDAAAGLIANSSPTRLRSVVIRLRRWRSRMVSSVSDALMDDDILVRTVAVLALQTICDAGKDSRLVELLSNIVDAA